MAGKLREEMLTSSILKRPQMSDLTLVAAATLTRLSRCRRRPPEVYTRIQMREREREREKKRGDQHLGESTYTAHECVGVVKTSAKPQILVMYLKSEKQIRALTTAMCEVCFFGKQADLLVLVREHTSGRRQSTFDKLALRTEVERSVKSPANRTHVVTLRTCTNLSLLKLIEP